MGKIIFRRIGGRIVPILNSGVLRKVLPDATGELVQDIRAARELVRAAKPTTGMERFLLRHQDQWAKRAGAKLGQDIAGMLRKLKGSK